ncbi:MAG TPA: hypothetical protein P5081_24930 [Phycisphaerae bacterium]|nr:hypothetical protein [Phycisphaerae bacterium]
MPQFSANSEITVDRRDIGVFGLAPASAMPSGLFGVIWRRFIEVLSPILNTIRNNQILLRLFWGPGDVKVSLRKIRPDLRPEDQMPGFVPWISGLRLAKADFPGLYAAIGNADATDDGSAETFMLPAHDNGYLRIAGDSETPGNVVTEIDTGSAVSGVLVALWIKT